MGPDRPHLFNLIAAICPSEGVHQSWDGIAIAFLCLCGRLPLQPDNMTRDGQCHPNQLERGLELERGRGPVQEQEQERVLELERGPVQEQAPEQGQAQVQEQGQERVPEQVLRLVQGLLQVSVLESVILWLAQDLELR